MKININKLSLFVIWLAVIFIGYIYFKYFYIIKDIYQFIIAVAPSLIFFTGGTLILSRDQKKRQLAESKEIYGKNTELNWGQNIKHDILTYLIPITILVLPFFSKKLPDLTTVFQASSCYIGLIYLKIMYWGEI